LQEADNDPTGEAAANTQQTLTFYELDLGLNHVVRKYSEALEEHGNFLITGSDPSECQDRYACWIRIHKMCCDTFNRTLTEHLFQTCCKTFI